MAMFMVPCVIGRTLLVRLFVDKTLASHNLFGLPVASVAQLAEQLTLNQLVLGSSPSRGTIFPYKPARKK